MTVSHWNPEHVRPVVKVVHRSTALESIVEMHVAVSFSNSKLVLVSSDVSDVHPATLCSLTKFQS
jgi:hypothetical protein